MRAANTKVGMRVFWNDPDPEGNSGWGKVVRKQSDFDDAVISLKMEDGGEVECYAHELSKDAGGPRLQNY